jgi:hypothetical protein
MMNGNRFRLTIPGGEDVEEVLRNAYQDPGRWISVDDETFISRENVESTN